LPLLGIESRSLGLRSHILITVSTETPGQLCVCNTHRKIEKYIPCLGETFVLCQGRAQYVASADRLVLPVKLAVSYLKGRLQ